VPVNLTPELVSAVGVAVAGILAAWNTRQGRRLKSLEDNVKVLEGWKLCATNYIGILRFALMQNGIEPAPAPKELGLEPATAGPSKEGTAS
jgi:hypothetical protein